MGGRVIIIKNRPFAIPHPRKIAKKRPWPQPVFMVFHDLPEDFQEILNPLFNPANPVSFTALLPPNLSAKLLDILTREIALVPLILDEESLREELNQKFNYRPTPSDERIRMGLWLEYENAIMEGRKMVVKNIHSLVCDDGFFYRIFVNKPWTVAFLLCRPTQYQEQVKEILAHGLRHMRRILDIPEYDAKGKLNLKLLELKARITGMMDMRIHGAPKQSIQQLNVNVDASKKVAGDHVKTLVQKGDMSTIQKRLWEIEQENKKLQGGPIAQQPEVMEAELVPVERK